jgi:predicted RNA-binding Zn ribbon-like protein
MASTSKEKRVDRAEFIFVGEHAAIDFANTISTAQGKWTEHFRAWPDVVDWLSLAGLSRNPSLNLSTSLGADALESVVTLRQAWKAVLAKLVAGGDVGDKFMEHLNGLLESDSFRETLQHDGRHRFNLVRSVSQLSGERLALVIFARQIALFLAEANLKYLRCCANTTSCVLYFYDTTKNHRRRWCSVAACGNRHKVAEFRKRQLKTKK